MWVSCYQAVLLIYNTDGTHPVRYLRMRIFWAVTVGKKKRDEVYVQVIVLYTELPGK